MTNMHHCPSPELSIPGLSYNPGPQTHLSTERKVVWQTTQPWMGMLGFPAWPTEGVGFRVEADVIRFQHGDRCLVPRSSAQSGAVVRLCVASLTPAQPAVTFCDSVHTWWPGSRYCGAFQSCAPPTVKLSSCQSYSFLSLVRAG